MKTIRLSLLAAFSALLLGASDIAPTTLPPPVSLKGALRIAEDYVTEKKIEVSHYYLGSVRIQSDTPGRFYWDVQWMNADNFKGGWFIVRVQMDKTAVLVHGK